MMVAINETNDFLSKAREALAGARAELVNKRYNNAANRAYYACFHAAIAALLDAGVRPHEQSWSHSFVQAQFSGLLIHRRKLYSSELGSVLSKNQDVRSDADYKALTVSKKESQRAVERARLFVAAVETKMGETE